MGIFDDEARKMAEEVDKRIQASTKDANALNLIARSIVRDLSTDSVSASQLEGIAVIVHRNVIRFTSRHRTLEVVCKSPDTFNLIDRLKGQQAQITVEPPLPLGTRGTPIDRGDMARRVLTWLKGERGVA
jgi:hypothetical protein